MKREPRWGWVKTQHEFPHFTSPVVWKIAFFPLPTVKGVGKKGGMSSVALALKTFGKMAVRHIPSVLTVVFFRGRFFSVLSSFFLSLSRVS